MLAYCFTLCQKFIGHRGFRMKVLKELVEIYRTLEVPDYINICECLYFLDDPHSVAVILENLIRESVVSLCVSVLEQLFSEKLLCS